MVRLKEWTARNYGDVAIFWKEHLAYLEEKRTKHKKQPR
jgi:hypothetical protein